MSKLCSTNVLFDFPVVERSQFWIVEQNPVEHPTIARDKNKGYWLDFCSVLVQTIDGIEFIKRLIVNFDGFQNSQTCFKLN